MKIRSKADIAKIDFDKQDGLVPVIIQDAINEQVLMLGYCSRDALEKTLETGLAWFFSRSRKRLWQKGETSGNVLTVQEIHADCDRDTLLVKAIPAGPACHKGTRSCFETETSQLQFLGELERLIRERKSAMPAGSYTTSLFEAGIERIAQKVGEEATETLIAALRQEDEDLLNETADLLYHLEVLLVEKGLSIDDVVKILRERHKSSD